MNNNNLPLRGAWLEIDLTALKNNLQIIRSLTGEKTLLMPVIKADAYGHGCVACASALIEAGADRFAVATLAEGVLLRRSGMQLPIHCLGYLPERQYQSAIDHDLIISIYDYDQARAISAQAAIAGKTALIHIKVDSGFTRLGFAADESAANTVARIASLPNLYLEGIFSHFSSADFADKTISHQQNALFQQFIRLCRHKGVDFPIRHIANSAAITDMPQYHYQLCRPGIIIYGYLPSADVQQIPGLQPVMSLKAEIARIMEIPPQTAVSYGCDWRAAQNSLIATIPLGYADGYSRLFGNHGSILVHGQRAPIVGRICMDHFMVDVTDINTESQLKRGDIVTVLGREGSQSITANDLAAQMSTINYEVLCLLGTRLPKVYIYK